MCFGLPGATAISSLFLAKVTGVPTKPAFTSLRMLVVSADAKTSAGAPCVIWATRALEPAKSYVNARLGLAATSVFFAALNALVSDAAANTLSGPVIAAEAVGVPLAGAVEALMAEASLPLAGDGGPDLAGYAQSLLERFSNRRLSYRLDQVARGGRDKVAQRLVPTLRALHERGVTPVWSALAVAAWSLHDGETLQAVAPDLWEIGAVSDAVAEWCRQLARGSPLAVIGAALGS